MYGGRYAKISQAIFWIAKITVEILYQVCIAWGCWGIDCVGDILFHCCDGRRSVS